jgi:hypothetical protein
MLFVLRRTYTVGDPRQRVESERWCRHPVDVPKCLGHQAAQRAASRVPVGKQDSSANRYLVTQLKRIAHRLPTQTPHEQLV